VQLVLKISNLYDTDALPLQTDKQTADDMQSQDRALHYCASRGKETVSKH